MFLAVYMNVKTDCAKMSTLNPLKCPKLGPEFSAQMCIAQIKWYVMQIIQLFIYQIKLNNLVN